MNKQIITKLLFVIWLGLFAASFIMFAITPATDFGFSRGLNRITVFFGWQIAATIAGLVLWLMGRNFSAGSLWRWLCRIPAIATALLLIGVFILFMSASYFVAKPLQITPQDPKPLTTPVVTTPTPIDGQVSR